MRNNQFRCAICNQTKDIKSMVMRKWRHRNIEEMGICRACNLDMNKSGYKTIVTYMKKKFNINIEF